MILDQKLAILQDRAAKRGASLKRLRDLALNTFDALEPVVQAQVQLRYECWADTRRSEINLVLARQTAEWMDARAAAKSAFGRAEVLRNLQEKLRK